MDIPNLSQPIQQSEGKTRLINPVFLVIILIFGAATGFGLSKITPSKSTNTNASSISPASGVTGIEKKEDIVTGKVYGNPAANFKDTATGVIEKGSINGEGTHILNRDGGASQRASLTSSSVDLDLFIGKKVEVKGETNASKKTAWLLDVGTIKVLE